LKLFAENNLKKWIVSLPIIGILFTSIVLTLLFINQTNKNHKRDILELEKLHLKHAKKIAKDRLLNIANVINNNQLINNSTKENLQKETQKFLNNFRFDNNNYIFAYDLKGNTISHIKQSLVGKNRWSLKKDGKFVVQELIKNAQKDNGHFMEYVATINPNTNLPAKKISYVTKLKNIDWIIGTGIYVEDLKKIIEVKELNLMEELNNTIITNVQIVIMFTIFGIIIMFLPANNIFDIIKRYRKILAQKNETLEEKVKERTKEQDTLLSLFNEADTVLFKWDYKTHKLIYVSKSISRILGYTEDEFLTQVIKYKDCIHKDDFRAYKNQYQQAIDNRRQFYEHLPYRIITKDNQIKWIHDYTLFVRDDNGEITNLIGYITDITLLKEHDKIIANQTKMASLGEMIGNIAHQWRQPLSTITTAASGMKMHKELDILSDDSFFKAISGIMRNSNYLSETINDFTNYIKDDKSMELFNLKEAISHNLLLLEGNIKINHINVIQDLDSKIKVYGNKHEIIQVSMNIINNAIDILKEKNQEFNKTIFLSTKQLENSILIQIKDNAGGIDEDVIDKIFEPYFTTKHQSQGTGLGLYMAHNIISNMQGELVVSNIQYQYENISYKGALFTIELPLNQ